MADLIAALREEARTAPVSGIIKSMNRGRDVPGLIPLWAGEGDLPTPRVICEAAMRSLSDGETYYTAETGIAPIREALAAYYERLYGRPVDAERFFITGSGMQAIQICMGMVAGAGDEVLVPSPAWPNVAGAAHVLGAEAVPVPMREEGGRFTLDVDDLAAAVTPRTRAIFINSPSNPTGWTADLDTLRAILALAREKGLWIVADEIYARFYWTGPRRAPSFLDIAEPDDAILYVNTFSKNWAMTGWRMGWIMAPPEIEQNILNFVQYSTSGTATFMQRAGVVALNECDFFVDHMVERARAGRAIVSEAFCGLNRVRYAAPDGAFYAFFKVDGVESSQELAFQLIDEAKVGTAAGTAFGEDAEGFVRICFCRSAESLREAMDRIVTFLAR